MIRSTPGARPDRRQFERDGVVCVRNAVDLGSLRPLERAFETLMSQGGPAGRDLAPSSSQGAFYSAIQVWRRSDTVRTFLKASGVARIAGELMGATEIRLLSDQLLVKEPEADAPTPWHQDLAYFPCSGDQICSVWIGLDPVSPSTGAMSFVRGSQRWPKLYQPRDFATGELWDEPRLDGPSPEIDPKACSVVCYSMMPGDLTVHHARTLHSSRGNASRVVRRRGYTVRLIGDDVRWDESGGRPAGFASFQPGRRPEGAEHPLLWSINADGSVDEATMPPSLPA